MHPFLAKLLIALICCLPSLAMAATSQTIHVEWGYAPPSDPAVTGYKLYQEGTAVCQVLDPNATALDCQVTLTSDPTSFTLTATFSDGTESPQSAPYAFSPSDISAGETVTPPAETTPPETPSAGSKLFTFNWTTATDPATLKGYRIYLNNSLLCETGLPTSTSLACKADLIHHIMVFSMTEVATDGSESSPSNLLAFDPTAYPELFNTRQLNFTWDYSASASVSGFRVYQNATPICQVMDPSARQLACTADLNSTPVTYTLTAINADGSETTVSNGLTYAGTETAAPSTGAILAVISANSTSGAIPLSINFNATSSIGDINRYSWDFGDGSVATGSTVSHAFSLAGSYTVKLTVTGASGEVNSDTITVNATAAPLPTAPPSAVLSSSTAAGQAPLTVNFDASGSSAASGVTIASYAWSFGDGGSASGSSASHTFTDAGTFTATLTVTDSKGLTATASTPIVITAPVQIVNKTPTAVISAMPASGGVPLTVSFDASASKDDDGSIASYVWNFGDGSTATGRSVTHTYTTKAAFAATLQVTDNLGATASTGTSVTVQDQQQQPALNFELGEVQITGNWVHVPFTSTYTNPIIIAGPAGFNSSEPGAIRLRNVSQKGFEIRFAEWNYQDGTHPAENVAYLVMERGHYTLPDGSMVEAGSFGGTTMFKSVPFTKAFAKTPVVVTTIASNNEADGISGRIKAVAPTYFAYYFREQELNANTHADETVHYIAWEPGAGSIGQVQFEVAKTANAVTDAWYPATLQSPFKQTPLLLADLQSTNEYDTASLRSQQQTAAGFQVKVAEEQSKDSETTHAKETVGYIALAQKEDKVLASFNWTFDPAQEANISGFEVLVNGNALCTSDSPSSRQVSCEMSKPTAATTFSIRAKDKTGSTTDPSNTLNFVP